MRTIFENFILIIFMTILSLLLSSYILIQLQITYASEFTSNAVQRIQASYHSAEIIADVQEKAAEAGYELVYEDVTADAYPDQKTALVTVKYEVEMPLVGIVHKGEKTRYAQ